MHFSVKTVSVSIDGTDLEYTVISYAYRDMQYTLHGFIKPDECSWAIESEGELTILLHKRYAEMWPSLCEADDAKKEDAQVVDRDWFVQFNPVTNRAHILIAVDPSAHVSDIRVKGVESSHLTSLSIQWKENDSFLLQTVSVDASLNTSIGNCYCCVALALLPHAQSGYFVVDLNVRHFCELIRHHDDVLNPLLVSPSLAPHRRTESATVCAPPPVSSAPAAAMSSLKASVASLVRPRRVGATCAK